MEVKPYEIDRKGRFCHFRKVSCSHPGRLRESRDELAYLADFELARDPFLQVIRRQNQLGFERTVIPGRILCR